MTSNTTLQTKNEGHGFYATIRHQGVDQDKAWTYALLAITEATDCSHQGARWFLDSTHGRHFADSVSNFMSAGQLLPKAIESAVAEWQGWTIGRRMSRETGIPAGLRYLTGLVLNADIQAEAEADALPVER